MNLLRNFGKPSSSSTLMLQMMLVNEGIKVSIYENGRVLTHAELTSPAVMNRLPPPLLHYLHGTQSAPEYIYLLAWPDAKQLCDSLKPYVSERFQLDCDAVLRLIPIERPAQFALRWIYSPTRKCLDRQLIYAERHLGKGWFQRDQYIWPLDTSLPEATLQWLSLHQIYERDSFWFVSQIIPIYQHDRLPISCNLTILNGFTLRLEILKAQARSIDVLLFGNMPGIIEQLRPLDGDGENMISGEKLLPGLHTVIADTLLKVAQSSLPVRFEGSALPALIQDDLRPHARQLGVDLQYIDQYYSVIDASTLTVAWKLDHQMEDGVGHYIARPYLGEFPLQTLVEALQKGERFYALEKGWIELTPAFLAQNPALITSGISEFQISPREMLGLQSARLKSTQLQLPQIDTAHDSPTVAQVEQFIDKLRWHGLPGGFSGLQGEVSHLLADECSHLLKDNPKARILWVVPQKKRAAAMDALQKAAINYASAEFVVETNRQVTLISPGASVELPRNWTLIIFQELDLLACSEAQIYFYSQLNRQWTLATFSSDHWYEDQQHAPQVMRALQLVPENIASFQKMCMANYPQQHTGPFPKLIPSFKKGSAAETDLARRDAALPPPPSPPPSKTRPTIVPARLSMEPPKPPPLVEAPVPEPVKAQPVKAAPLNVEPINAAPVNESFVAQARRYANRVEPKTDPIAFAQYWPTYEAMTPAQQKWYFYWRSQVRQGNYLPADLSYLFLHVYEVLNLVGFTVAQSAFDYLVKFWQHYRPAQPKLDRFLIDWLADFVVVYKLPSTPIAWYIRVLREGAIFGDFDLYIEAWVQAGGNFAELPTAFLYRLLNYSPVKTKFYQEYQQDKQLDAVYKKAVQTVDVYSREHGKALVEKYHATETYPIVREPFAGALHELDHQPIQIAKVGGWSANRPLLSVLTSIVKYTENILRQQAQFNTMLQGIELPKEWMAVLDQAFRIAPRRQININTGMVRTLKRESDEIRQRLIIEEDNIEAEANESLTQIMAIVGDRESFATRLLHLFREQRWTATESTLRAVVENGHVLDSELDYLNKRAVKELGDELICENDGWFVVAEDYRDEIEYVLEHPRAEQDTVSTPAVVPPSGTGDTGKYAELDEAWAKFARQMKPQHWEVLTILLAKVDVSARVDAIARSSYSTASTLIDDINAFALDSIGDIVISTKDNTLYIEDEDIDGIQTLLAWASSNDLLEKA